MNSSGVLAYANVQSRVRGMAGKLLSATDWARLHSSVSLEALIDNLIATNYSEYLVGIKDLKLATKRTAFEIRKRLANAFIKLIRNAPDSAKPLIRQMFLLYEVDNLKATLRGIELAEPWEKIRYMLFPMEGYPTLPFQAMAEAGNIISALQLLSNTSYHKVLTPALERYTQENTLFPLEIALDLDYWQQVWTLINQLPKADWKIATHLLGLIIDKNNLTWAARYRIYHNLSDFEIINYTLSFGDKVNDAIINQIASGKPLQAVVSELYPRLFDSFGKSQDEESSLPMIEVMLNRQINAKCKDAFVGSPFNIGIILGYLIQLEYEIQDIILLLEAKSLGIPGSSYMNYLINSIDLSMMTSKVK